MVLLCCIIDKFSFSSYQIWEVNNMEKGVLIFLEKKNYTCKKYKSWTRSLFLTWKLHRPRSKCSEQSVEFWKPWFGLFCDFAFTKKQPFLRFSYAYSKIKVGQSFVRILLRSTWPRITSGLVPTRRWLCFPSSVTGIIFCKKQWFCRHIECFGPAMLPSYLWFILIYIFVTTYFPFKHQLQMMLG